MIIVVIVAVILGITVAMAFIMGWIGITIMSFLYGIDFEQFRGLVFIMLAAGGVTACIDFLYQVVTVLRQQRTVTKLYLITFGFSLFVPVLLVNFTGLPGAIIGYLIVMCILLVLLVWEYGKVRMALAERDKQEAAAHATLVVGHVVTTGEDSVEREGSERRAAASGERAEGPARDGEGAARERESRARERGESGRSREREGSARRRRSRDTSAKPRTPRSPRR